MAISFVKFLGTVQNKNSINLLSITGLNESLSVGDDVFAAWAGDPGGSGHSASHNGTASITWTKDADSTNSGNVQAILFRGNVTAAGTLTSINTSWTTDIDAKAMAAGLWQGVGALDDAGAANLNGSTCVVADTKLTTGITDTVVWQSGDLVIGSAGWEGPFDDSLTAGSSNATWSDGPTEVAQVGTSGQAAHSNITVQLIYGIASSDETSAEEAALWGSNATSARDWAGAGAAYSPSASEDADAEVSWAELETPFANADAEVSWTELEVPTASADAEVAWTELEVPFANADAEVSWTEVEIPFQSADAEVAWTEFEVPTANADAEVAWTEFEVPTADADGEVAWAELEVPFQNSDGEVSFAEFEVPTTDADAEISWAEFEVPFIDADAEVSWTEMEFPQNSDGEVSWAEFEVPFTPADAEVSWAEFEVPLEPADAEISWAELEVPFVDAQAEVSWAEVEIPFADADAEISWAEFAVPSLGAVENLQDHHIHIY